MSALSSEAIPEIASSSNDSPRIPDRDSSPNTTIPAPGESLVAATAGGAIVTILNARPVCKLLQIDPAQRHLIVCAKKNWQSSLFSAEDGGML